MITKVLQAWTKEFKLDAWSAIVNALAGSWGEITFNTIGQEETTMDLIRGTFDHSFTTTQTGTVTLNLPQTLSGICNVSVSSYSGNVVSLVQEYVITSEGASSISITLPTTSSLIRMTGKLRRL